MSAGQHRQMGKQEAVNGLIYGSSNVSATVSSRRVTEHTKETACLYGRSSEKTTVHGLKGEDIDDYRQRTTYHLPRRRRRGQPVNIGGALEDDKIYHLCRNTVIKAVSGD